MDALHLSTPDTAERTDLFEVALRKERDGVRDFVAAKQRQLDEAHDRLLESLDGLAREDSGGRSDDEGLREAMDRQAAQLAQEADRLEQLRADLDACRAEWERSAGETTRHQEALLATLRQEQHALEQQRASLEQQQAAFERRQAECIEIDRTERESLQKRLLEANARQDRLAGELAALQTQCDTLRKQASAAGAVKEEREALLRERDALRISLRESEERLEAARREIAGLESRGAAETSAETLPRAAGDADLECRYQLLVDDLSELKRENARLEEDLKEAQSSRPTAQPASPSGGALDWEAEKQRILAALESECDEADGEACRKRLEIEEIVQRTERIVAEKDAEIAELKQLLQDQSASVGSLAVGAAALGEMLDKDAVIQEERRNLTQLQEEWREKLRKAEVDMSVERAKLARQRTEVEEQMRLLEERAASLGDAPGGATPAEKPPRNRWLTRLGLKDTENGAS